MHRNAALHESDAHHVNRGAAHLPSVITSEYSRGLGSLHRVLCPLLPYPPRWLTYSSDLLPETVIPFNSNRPRGRRPYFHRWCYWQSRLSKVDRFTTTPLASSHLFLHLFTYASFERQPSALSIWAYCVHNRPTPCAYSALTVLAIRNPFGLVIPWSPDWAFYSITINLCVVIIIICMDPPDFSLHPPHHHIHHDLRHKAIIVEHLMLAWTNAKSTLCHINPFTHFAIRLWMHCKLVCMYRSFGICSPNWWFGTKTISKRFIHLNIATC